MSEPFVISLLVPLAPGDEPRLDRAGPAGRAVEVLVAPYVESQELRSARSQNGGRVHPSAAHLVPEIGDELRTALARSDAVVALDLPPDLTVLAPRLGWVQAVGAGVDHLDLAQLEAMGVVVTNASGVAAAPIAEFVIARLLQVWKELRRIDAQQRAHTWKTLMGPSMADKTIGIVGLGAIGRAVARRSRAFDCDVVATRRSARPGDTDPDVDILFAPADVSDLIGRCDAVVLSAPATSETAGMVDAGFIAAMRPGAILVNVARGSLVDEEAVVAALNSGQLGAAVLDVTAQEPLPAGHPLWDAPNCYLSPHSAASLDGYGERVLALTTTNLEALLSGAPMVNVVLDNR